MPLSHLEHFLILTDDMEGTRDWFVEVLGFRVGESPDFGVPAYWLYLGDNDVVHIAQGTPGPRSRHEGLSGRDAIAEGGRPIHHVAFRATGLAEMRAHLESRGVEFLEQQATDQDLYQLFVQDPNGVTVELNFPAEEAEHLDAVKLALRREEAG